MSAVAHPWGHRSGSGSGSAGSERRRRASSSPGKSGVSTLGIGSDTHARANGRDAASGATPALSAVRKNRSLCTHAATRVAHRLLRRSAPSCPPASVGWRSCVAREGLSAALRACRAGDPPRPLKAPRAKGAKLEAARHE